MLKQIFVHQLQGLQALIKVMLWRQLRSITKFDLYTLLSINNIIRLECLRAPSSLKYVSIEIFLSIKFQHLRLLQIPQQLWLKTLQTQNSPIPCTRLDCIGLSVWTILKHLFVQIGHTKSWSKWYFLSLKLSLISRNILSMLL